jgi:hypothetical protein
MPAMFGGSDIEVNVVYVPAFAAELKDRTDRNVILPLAQEGKFRHYSARPEYEGTSFVPVAIRLEATDPGSFSWYLTIWGDAVQTVP